MAVAFMRFIRLTGAAAVVAAALLGAPGCDEADVARTKPAPPATRAAADAPPQPNGAKAPGAAPAPETQPASAFLTIDGAATEFPPARLRLMRTDEGVRALLFSDDPPRATAADYRGNSFYFEAPLKVNDPGEIHGADYWYKAPVSDAEEDLPYGIFLGGIRGTHLQPQDVVFKFDADGNKVMVRVAGRFLVVDQQGRGAPGKFAGVVGTLYTTAETKD